jgi:hypothetical protein
MTQVLLPPIVLAQQTCSVFGRTYTAAPGAVVTAPDGDAAQLLANGWLTPQAVFGAYATTARPTSLPNGQTITAGLTIIDTTLAEVIQYDGDTWRKPATGASV